MSRIGKSGQRVDNKGRYLDHVPKWEGWDVLLNCDNCARSKYEARLFKAKVSMDQWNWLGGKAIPTMDVLKMEIDPLGRTMRVCLCEVCVAYIQENWADNNLRILNPYLG